MHSWLAVSTFLLLPLFHGTSSQIISPSVPPVVVQSEASQIETEDSSPCSKACAALASKLPSQLFLKNTGDFDFWDAKVFEQIPACRVEPASVDDVSFIVKTAVESKCHFAVKSGGHARTPGFSNAKGGLTIDLVRLNSVQLSSDKKSATIGAGSRWADVYKPLEKHNLLVIGGRVADVGVGGLTLGGGISFFSNRYGWACDSVISYEIVLPDGTISNIDQKSNPDLYFALRGAGQVSFGVVTAFTFETIPLPNPAGLWIANKTYDWSKFSEVTEQHYKYYTESSMHDLDTGGFNIFIYFKPYKAWWLFDSYVHTTHPTTDSWPEIFQPFESIEALPNATNVYIKPFSEITYDIEALNPYHSRNTYSTFTFRPNLQLQRDIATIFREEVEKVMDKVGESYPTMGFHLLSKSALSNMAKNGGNALGLSAEDGPLVIGSIAWMWKDAKEDEETLATVKTILERAKQRAEKDGLYHPFRYPNYSEGFQDVWFGFGDTSLKRLIEIQRKVDPNGIFSTDGLVKGGFRLHEKLSVPKEKHKDEL